VVAKLLPKTDPVHKVTIIPRGRALGVTMQLPEEDRYSTDRERMLSTIAVLFGGRIAEEVFMNQMTTGASNDFERATQMARDMVTRYGMSDARPDGLWRERGRGLPRPLGHHAQEHVRRDDAQGRCRDPPHHRRAVRLARKLLEDNRDKVRPWPSALLEWETIDADQIDDIMAGRRRAAQASAAGVCLMHMQGEPRRCSRIRATTTWSARCIGFLGERVAALEAAGMARAHRARSRLRLRQDAWSTTSNCCARSRAWWPGLPLLVGCRASPCWARSPAARSTRLHASVAAALLAVQRGARIVRVHDVAATRDALKVWAALSGRARIIRQGGATDGRRKYFGTDGMRGGRRSADHAGFRDAAGLCRRGPTLVAREKLPAGERPAVLIGKDTRISGYMLEAALEAGLCRGRRRRDAVRADADAGVAYLTRALRLQAGVVISASHNPFDDNGIKFFSADGRKLPDAWSAEIEARLDEPMGRGLGPLGKARRIDDAAGRYIEFCKSTFPNELDLRGMKIVVDCAHGAAYHVAPKVFHELGAEVIRSASSPTASTSTTAWAPPRRGLRGGAQARRRLLGIALDGDADRLHHGRRRGRLYDGDKLLYVMACATATPKAGVTGRGRHADEQPRLRACAGRARRAVRARQGGRPLRAGAAAARGWQLGGENSGHIICLDRHTTGDGIVARCRCWPRCAARGFRSPTRAPTWCSTRRR
jgi:phosphoglucosamine mutase